MNTVKFRYEHGWFKVKRKGIRVSFYREFETDDPNVIKLLRDMRVDEVLPRKRKKKEVDNE